MAEEIINNIPSADLDAMLESLFGHAEQVPDAAPFPSNIPDAAPLLPVSTPVRGIPSSPSSSTANVAFMLDSQGDSARFLQGVGNVETKHEEKEIKLTVYDYQPLKDYACHVQHAGEGKANVLCLQFRDEKHFNSFNDRWDRKRKKYCSEENDIVFTNVIGGGWSTRLLCAHAFRIYSYSTRYTKCDFRS
jgi:hypothetical protein